MDRQDAQEIPQAVTPNSPMRADNTIVLSDLHLADAEPPHPRKPLWKRFKQADLFIDESFKKLLEYLESTIAGPIELVLNGDIFDFDSVMAIPAQPRFTVSLLERLRGLSSEEPKSLFKIDRILRDHPVFVEALRNFIVHGHRVVFVFGNHDMELHWPSVQREIGRHLGLTVESAAHVRFVEWFYLSNGDTLIEHGNQYDSYCLCHDPLFPFIRRDSKRWVRIPFGDLAGKYMTNGMGLFNPHVESSFIMSMSGYAVFFFRYLIRIQPLLMWAWIWGAMVTLFVSLREGLMPADKDPLMISHRIESIAHRSNATPGIVMALHEMRAHPAIFNPFMILRELWLDRLILFGLIVVVSFQIFSFLNVFVPVSSGWFWIPLLLLLEVFIFYARSVRSDIYRVKREAMSKAPVSAAIAGVKRIIHGHTHLECATVVHDVELFNNGTWSPSFSDVECTRPTGKKCFTWIRPAVDSSRGESPGTPPRSALLYLWTDSGIEEMPPSCPDFAE